MNQEIYKLILNSNKNQLPSRGIYTFLNPFSYLLLRKSQLLTEFDAIYIDGISLVKLLALFKIKVPRKSFDMTSLAKLVFEDAINNNKSIYFIGAKSQEVDKFIQIIKISFPKLNICGYRDGYFNSNDDKKKEINNLINNIAPDIVVVGMGTPLQEEFLIDLKKHNFNGVAYTCGGFIHQTSKGINYYPIIINKFNLRWLYRIFDEPKLFKRYFFVYPKAIVYLLKDLISINNYK